MSLDYKLGGVYTRASSHTRDRLLEPLKMVQVDFCDRGFGESGRMSEENVPLGALSAFYGKHERHALLALKYPRATVVKDQIPRRAVECFARSLVDEVPASAYACVAKGSYDWACVVAEEASLVVWPKQESDACIVSAYAISRSKEVFDQICWTGSVLTPLQRSYTPKYDLTDFEHWVR